MRKTKNSIYAAYCGDKFLTVGTARGVADYFKWDVNNVYVHMCKSYKKLYKTTEVQIFPVEEGEDDEKN